MRALLVSRGDYQTTARGINVAHNCNFHVTFYESSDKWKDKS